MFEPTPLNVSNRRKQLAVRLGFLAMTLLLILPVVLILRLLVIKGAPAISFEFLFTMPKDAQGCT